MSRAGLPPWNRSVSCLMRARARPRGSPSRVGAWACRPRRGGEARRPWWRPCRAPSARHPRGSARPRVASPTVCLSSARMRCEPDDVGAERTTFVELDVELDGGAAQRHGRANRRAAVRATPRRPWVSEASQRTGLHFAVMLSQGLLARPDVRMDSPDGNTETPARPGTRDVSFSPKRPCHGDPRDGTQAMVGGAATDPVTLGPAVSLARSRRVVSRSATLVDTCRHSAGLPTRQSARFEPRRRGPGMDAPSAGGIVWIRHERSAVWTI